MPSRRLEKPAGVPAIERALTVLEMLASSRRGYSVSELSRRLDLPKSSVHLILRTLERRGYLQRDEESGRYRVGLGLVGLAGVALKGFDVREEARPALASLAQATNLTTHLSVLERGDVVVIETIESTAPVRVVSWVGRRLAANATAEGRVLLAFGPSEELERRLADDDLRRHGERTVATMQAARQELDRVRAQGYTVCDEDDVGARSVSAPILDHQGRAVAAIGVSGTRMQIPTDRIPALAEAVVSSAREIAGRLRQSALP